MAQQSAMLDYFFGYCSQNIRAAELCAKGKNIDDSSNAYRASINQGFNMMMSRRSFVCLGSVSLLGGCLSVQANQPIVERDWRLHFDNLARPAILVDSTARRLAFWAANDATYREFPVGVPMTDEFLRTGRTSIVRKKAGPTWSPTPSMIRRNPQLPRFVAAGPENPLGAYALYLGWQYFAIHGTNDPVTIGRRTTSGCFRLFAGHIEWLYENAPIGTRVLVI